MPHPPKRRRSSDPPLKLRSPFAADSLASMASPSLLQLSLPSSLSRPAMIPLSSSNSTIQSPSLTCNSFSPVCSRFFQAPLLAGGNRLRRRSQIVRMAPDEEKMVRRSPLDFPVEWEKARPGRRPEITPQFSPMKTPLPPPLPIDPPLEDEEEEEEEQEQEEPEKEGDDQEEPQE